MDTKKGHLLKVPFWERIIIIVFILCFVLIASVEAAVTVRSFTGTVEVLLQSEGTWKPASEAMELNAGDEIMIGKGSSAELLCEDGSELHLEEETQLAISELEFSVAEKTRVSRFKLIWGTVTAKAASLVGLRKNTFEVETDTVVAGFKFSSMKIIAKQAETLEDKPSTTILPLEGKFEIQQIVDGTTDVECLLESVQGGLMFSLGLNAVIELEIDQTPGNEKITVKCNVLLRDMRALMGPEHNILRIKNFVGVSDILVGFQSYGTIVKENSVARFGFSFAQAVQELLISAEGIHGEFSFDKQPGLWDNRYYIFADMGTIETNGQRLRPETSISFPIDEQPQPVEEKKETPVVPPGPEQERHHPKRPPEETTGSPITP